MSSFSPPNPQTGAKPSLATKKPFYKRIWFLILVGLVIIGYFAPDPDEGQSDLLSETSPSISTSLVPTTTTLPEKNWTENLKTEVLGEELLKSTCTGLKKVIKSQTKLIDKRIAATEKPSKDPYESAAYIKEIDWAFNPHVASVRGFKRDATDPVLTLGSIDLPTNTQYSDFLDEAVSACGLLPDSNLLDNSALGLDNRLSTMISSASNLPWYPQDFKEYFPGVAFKKAKRSLDCYSCWGIVYEVITNKSCPNQLYVQANFIDSSGAVFDWSNDTVQAFRAGQIAYVELYTYGYSGSGTVELTEVNCY